ncbi:unnamed protein product [Clonostachys solani]|uniref:Uncharacterized protein n=1 Tax=Clonostachys solani TaxID=160281 RepID=A0A9N9Z769_9HYPO|nr:unnamed protein product [Clonostachys solani]
MQSISPTDSTPLYAILLSAAQLTLLAVQPPDKHRVDYWESQEIDARSRPEASTWSPVTCLAYLGNRIGQFLYPQSPHDRGPEVEVWSGLFQPEPQYKRAVETPSPKIRKQKYPPSR